MHQVNIHQAKTQLSKLIQEALNGEEVVIAKGNKPLIRLDVLPSARKQRQLDGRKNMVLKIAEDFDAPLDDFSEYM